MSSFAETLFAALGENAFHTPIDQPGGMETLQLAWKQYIERVQAEAPYAVIADGGETVFSGTLSPGCRACKAGQWDCLFLTMDCNLACAFCCSPAGQGRRPALSALGQEIGQVVANLHTIRPGGISFSGGEIFLEFERLHQMVTIIRREFPEAYLWAYTNGLMATGENLAELGEIGLDEIRFNMAATGYFHPQVLNHLEKASRCIPHITVEIPAIPEQKNRLLEALSVWSSIGVQYLNLHELMYEPGSPSASLPGQRVGMHTPDGHFTEFHPKSRELVLQVMQKIHEQGLLLATNDCSMQNKLRQVRGRRNLIGKVIQGQPSSTEIYHPDGLLETVCVFNFKGQAVFIHPEDLEEVRDNYPGWLFARLWRTPPLSVFAAKTWLRWEEV